MEHPIQILERYWNFTNFRPLQEDIITSVLEGNDTFALLPTGGGKSICFQVPALAQEGICIVISPLIALMKNQVQSLKDKGIKAMALTSGIKFSELDSLLDNCIYGNYKFLYLSPERLQQEIVQDRIRQMNVSLIAVDEAHCISQWGNDFRPSYKNITLLRQLQPSVNVIALTASATPKVVDDIVSELDFINPKIFKQSFSRPNLAYMVFNEEDKHYRLEKILKKNSQSSIIYVRSRKLSIEISNYLESKGFTSTFFHGGITNEEKDIRLNQWLNNQKQVVVATNAFGMGIDKPDVKTVIHINLPESIESYFQEAGRAGRNGKKAFSIILKNKGDETRLKQQFLNILPTKDLVKQVYKKLCNYFQISYGEGVDVTNDFNFNAFCKTYNFNAITTFNALQILDRNSIISMSPQFNNKSSVQFIISNNQLFSYLEKNQNLSIITKSILRTYGGIFEQEVKINIHLIANKVGTSEKAIINTLKQLEKDNVITLKLSKTDTEITFIQPREDDKTINRIAEIIEIQNKLKQDQVESVLRYINNDSICKSMQLLSYFGETNLKPCGICSVCLNDKKKDFHDNYNNIRKEIITILEKGNASSRTLSEKLSCSEENIKDNIKNLLEDDIIEITKTNTYKLKHMAKRDLRIVFMGTPDFAVTTLKSLVDNKYNIVGVITAPDKPAGRGQKLHQSAVKKYAESVGLNILQPTNLKNDNFVSELKMLNANLQIVVAFRMLPKVVWQMPEYGTFNLHASLLPNYRGAAPINWAVINGETKTGVSTFFIDEKIDTGEMILQEEVEIGPTENAGNLHDKLMNIGSELVIKTVQQIENNTVTTTHQPENLKVKTAYKLNKDNCKINWNDTLDNIYNKVRGLSPYPSAWSKLFNNNKELNIKIYKVDKEENKHNHELGNILSTKKEVKIAVTGGYINLLEIQLPGKRKMDIKSLLNGYNFSKDAKML